MRPLAGGRGPRAAADRGARAAVQPAVEVSRSGCVWLKLTAEAYPRLSVVRAAAADGAAYLGPFAVPAHGRAGRRRRVYEALPLRQCTPQALGRARRTPACALAELGRCPAPCEHADHPGGVRRAAPPRRSATAIDRRPGPGGATRCWPGSTTLSDAQRYEEAAAVRDPAGRAAARRRPDAAAGRADRARRAGRGPAAPSAAAGRSPWSGTAGWPRAATSAPASHPRPTLDVLRADRRDGPRRGPGRRRPRRAEETERILAWLERPETRLVEASGGWASPVAWRGALRDSAREGGSRPQSSGRDPFAHR